MKSTLILLAASILSLFLVESCSKTKPFSSDNTFHVRGVVIDEGHNPIAMATVSLKVNTRAWDLTTGEAGSFDTSFLGGDSLIVGLSVLADGYMPFDDTLVVKQSEIDLSIVLKK